MVGPPLVLVFSWVLRSSPALFYQAVSSQIKQQFIYRTLCLSVNNENWSKENWSRNSYSKFMRAQRLLCICMSGGRFYTKHCGMYFHKLFQSYTPANQGKEKAACFTRSCASRLFKVNGWREVTKSRYLWQPWKLIYRRLFQIKSNCE